MENKEEIYEAEIKPLVDRIHDLAKEHGIPFIMAFEVSETALLGSYFLPEGNTCQQLELASNYYGARCTKGAYEPGSRTGNGCTTGESARLGGGYVTATTEPKRIRLY